jgi:predicted metal-dependent phosphoesterase TrpH
MYADLHIHSTHSDGSQTPEAIVLEARARNVSLISITDHELLCGSLEAEPIARRAGIGFLRGAEVQGRADGRFYHILAYGVDAKDRGFSALIGDSRQKLDDMSVELIRRLEPQYPHISVEDFDLYEREAVEGGWKGLEYLYRRGVTAALRDGMALYAQYGVTYEDAGFPPLCSVLRAIRGAGGRAVLAHPGITVPQSDEKTFLPTINRLIDAGLDGLECYYPLHTHKTTRALTALCRDRNLIITAGSDCHGAFGRTHIGQMMIPVEALSLKELRG